MAAVPGAGPSATSGLNVIALVSGGKDSFFSALHCLENGHRVVALANLHPPPPAPRPNKPGGDPDAGLGLSRLDLDPEKHGGRSPNGGGAEEDEKEEDEEETDLNSFMYQTVGHQVIPLYADATGIPLYRRPILGGAVHHGRDYSAAAAAGAAPASPTGEGQDETESMTWLLKEIMQKHPEANALSAGAILSTYQRTRVESVAVRLGLTPLAYLWKYPMLPGPAGAEEDEEAQLLVDMAAAGVEARLLKVASGGLDDSFLWENVASARGVMRLKRAMGRFGASAESGAVLGEGGEFETLVVDGPARLFKRRIVVGEDDRVVVSEGGGAAWLRIQRAKLEDKPSGDGDEQELIVRRPDLLDRRFAAVLERIRSSDDSDEVEDTEDYSSSSEHAPLPIETRSSLQTWAVTRPVSNAPTALSIKEETELLMEEIRNRLNQHNLSPNSIISTIISLRRMSDFPAINTIYGSLFTEPNPPSRVTISCGDLLPQNTNIAIYLTVHAGKTDRQGLHVQGRSYWAPANIGPYSQAITIPIQSLLETGGEASSSSTSNSSNGPRVVHIAGQIPLIPASMELPTDGLEMQLALSLQHLWRIGVELGVQWWTSGAVYFPRNGGGRQQQQQRSKYAVSAREKALLAWRAWKVAHTYKLSSGDDDDEDGDGPDLWDRKFNPAYMSYGGAGGGAEKQKHSLPDYSVLQGGDDEEDNNGVGKKPVPFFFAAEVDELPRSAEAEWHAHAGLARVGSSSDSESPEEVAIYNQSYKTGLGRCRVNHCALTSDAGVSLHSVAAVEVGDASASRADVAGALDGTIEEMDRLLGASMRRDESVRGGALPRPYLLYVDSSIFGQEQIGSAMRDKGLAVVPCASLYGGSRGTRLAMVALYRNLSPAA
ncbi:hypothetical protein VMCG_01277 [Cytospora schulzeri]|uniref:Diphthine--ammonia ligase n=1 Tax=Cytospora schulzeri TaxID=448051 RepID=A0A423X6Z1_9PEZI|nr:hypothetical protein VMCG_01277 [Valsa malicola]